MDTFTWEAYSDNTLEDTAYNIRVEFENALEQIQQTSINNKVIWEMKYQNVHSVMLEIKAFFDNHCHGEEFYWTDRDGTTHTVTFANDSCKLTQKYGLSSDGSLIQGDECTLQFRKVWDT